MDSSASYLDSISELAPPALLLPQISFSAPASRRPSVPGTPRRPRAASQPTSPVAKKLGSPIGKKLAPKSPTRSPAHYLRKHRPHASIVGRREHRPAAPCAVHSYTNAEQEIRVMPDRVLASKATKFGDAPREPPPPESCPVHSYANAEQEIRVMPDRSLSSKAVPFGDAPRDVPVRPGCPIHVYAEARSTLKDAPATFAKHVTPRASVAPGEGPNVHAYATPRSTLASTAAPFGTEARRLGAFAGVERALAPVHSYAGAASSLKRTGGTMAMASGRSGWLHCGTSRTGLVPAAAAEPTNGGAALAPRPRTLKPLHPSKENVTVKVLSPPAEKAAAAGGGSPREVEAAL